MNCPWPTALTLIANSEETDSNAQLPIPGNQPTRKREGKRARKERERKGGKTLGPESIDQRSQRARASLPPKSRVTPETREHRTQRNSARARSEHPWPTALPLIANNEHETRAPGTNHSTKASASWVRLNCVNLSRSA